MSDLYSFDFCVVGPSVTVDQFNSVIAGMNTDNPETRLFQYAVVTAWSGEFLMAHAITHAGPHRLQALFERFSGLTLLGTFWIESEQEHEGVPSYQVEGRDGVIKVTNRFVPPDWPHSS